MLCWPVNLGEIMPTKGKHRHSYEFRQGVMKSPACRKCGRTPTTSRICLSEPKDSIAILTHDHCPANCSCSKTCPTIQWEIE